MSDLEKGTTERVAGGQNIYGYSPSTSTPAQPSKIGNPGALGLMSFASTTFILSLFNLQTRGVAEPNVVVGMAVFCGGLVQLLAGMWEFPRGNVFGATAFSSYGAFWMSYATILIPSSGVLAAYADDEAGLHNALGIYLMTWMVVTAIFLIAALRRNIAFIALLTFLTITFAILAVAEFTGKSTMAKAGGALGVITALIAFYCSLSELLIREESYVMLPLGVLPKRTD